ncbi:MAG TPA: histidinol-phosphate transaminase [Anaerolineae bacterium]|nr:histidinol-phosphate transaminase [Anaerolineae bacterium]
MNIRPDIARMAPYQPVKPFEALSREMGRAPETIIKLDANENPYGPSPRVPEALARYPWYHIYPDPQQTQLREALADYVGVPADYILPGHGADELIDYLCRIMLEPGDAIINCPPTFGMYDFDARLSMGRVIEVSRDADFRIDAAAIEEAAARAQGRAKILFLTSPNNPDGGLLAPDDLDRLLALPLLVVVDEAYIEFADAESVAPRVPKTPNLVVLRTFSKWAGLAGLRLGYGVFPPFLMEALWKFKQPYNVNVAATVAGLASLRDLPLLRQRIAALKQERDRLYRELDAIPHLHPLPSQANFILCQVEGRSAQALHRTLWQQGILVRYYDKPGLRNAIRISAGPSEHIDRLLAALRAWAAQ